LSRRVTAILVAAIAAIAIAALVDSLRGDDRASTSSPPPPTTTEQRSPPTVAGRLAARQITGVLYAAVREGQICRVEAIALPSLDLSALIGDAACRIHVSPSGRVAAGGGCPGKRVATQTGAGFRSLAGCAPAWRPDGRLTFVRNGDVVELREPCASIQPCLAVVVPRSRFPGRIIELAWLGPTRLAALVQGSGGPLDRSIAIVDGGRLVSAPPPCCPMDRYLEAVGDRLFVRSRGPDSPFLLFDARGRFLGRDALPGYLSDGRSFAASPDGSWVASTLRDTIEIYHAGTSHPLDPVELDFTAVDLGWGTS
jgi:hypothetical protein